jgi:hypothetical protein
MGNFALAAIRNNIPDNKALVLRYGEPGCKIPGSRMLRAYCPSCGGPMRVTPSSRSLLKCSSCQHAEDFHPGYNSTRCPRDGGEDPGWHDAVRAIEAG